MTEDQVILNCDRCQKQVETDLKLNGGDPCYLCRYCQRILAYKFEICPGFLPREHKNLKEHRDEL